MRKTLVIPIVTGLVGFSLLAAPLAAHAEDTPVTFDLSAGTLSISAQTSSQTLTSAGVGAATVSGSLGDVAVTDDRGDNSDSWTATVDVSTAFSTTGSTGDDTFLTLPDSDVNYSLGNSPAPVILASDVAAGESFTSDTALVPLSGAPTTVYAATDEPGSSAVTWDPTLTLDLPTYDQVQGTYSGTITYSVS